MSTPRAKFDRAKWRSNILLPLWALQLMFTTSTAGLFAWRLSEVAQRHGEAERRRNGEAPDLELAWQIINIIFASATSACTFFEMARFVGEVLTPRVMVVTHTFKLASGIIILAFDVAVYVVRKDVRYSLVGLGLDLAQMLVMSSSSSSKWMMLTIFLEPVSFSWDSTLVIRTVERGRVTSSLGH
ncbi:hypothetical protein CDD80_1988 [Ophiocordyceps camponoti-rufipedis]|uniref:Uncharacterized protein n=1 Tax=Ophiocordyceps camponoti-rufipedis TaxID=2004952 RepID=A0A2C5Z878_9HYPO|nr:hypothetical protein CDD80_1988 [Ophiocordyceps camponoti-rufipedis]